MNRKASIQRRAARLAVASFDGSRPPATHVVIELDGTAGLVRVAMSARWRETERMRLGLLLARLRRDLPRIDWSGWMYLESDERAVVEHAARRSVERS